MSARDDYPLLTPARTSKWYPLAMDELDSLRTVNAGLAVELQDLRELLGELYLYVNWRSCTRPLTTAQKNLWADCVDAWVGQDQGEPLPAADRWWGIAVTDEPTTKGNE